LSGLPLPVRVFLVAAGLCCAPAWALDPGRGLTQYVHRIWQTQNGLPQTAIYALAQTHDGYLLLGTQGGLLRFDSYAFSYVQATNRQPLDDFWAWALLEDSKDRLWIGTADAGLFRLDHGATRQYTQRDGLPSDAVLRVVEDRHGVMWACTPNGIARIGDDKIQVYQKQQGLPTNTMRAGAVAKDGTLWFGGDSTHLVSWNGAEFTDHALTSIPPGSSVRALLFAQDGTLWIGTTDGLIQMKGGHERRFARADGLSDNLVYSLTESRDGSLWIGTLNGFSRLRNGALESYRSKDGLSQSTVFAIQEDREGSVWVATKHGLNQFLDGRSIPYTVNEGLPSNNTGPVIEDRRGQIWAGTLDTGLARFNGRWAKPLTVRQGLASDQMSALAEDGSGDLWAGTNRGLSRLHDGQVDRTYTTRDGLPSNHIRSLLRDRSGRIWAGTQAGPAVFTNGTFVQPEALRSRLRVPIRAIGEDHGGTLYFATENGGVYAYAGGVVKEVLGKEGPLRDADAFYTDQDGLVWVGMLVSGMRLIENGQVHSFSVRDGLFDGAIAGIVADTQGRLWMACSKGLFSVSRADLLGFAAGKIRKVASTPYSPLDALRTIECRSGVQPAVWAARDGKLWFSTIRGLMVLDPRHMRLNAPPPPVVIEDVTVNGESSVPERVSKLEPGQKNLEFQYTGLSFVRSDLTTFRYMLEGYDKNWINAGTRREAFYTNLPPGRFRFHVTACNSDGACNPEGAAVAFALAPRYYQQPWFLPSFVMLLCLGGWLTYQLRIRGLREQFGLVLAERNRIARELHDTLIQGFSGITMQMQALSARIRSTEARDTLNDIIRDAGDCLRETRRSVAGLRSEPGSHSGLASAIANTAREIAESGNARLKLKVGEDPGGLAADVQYNLLRIVQEAVANSVKHSGARNIEVALDSVSDRVRLVVTDDGSGFTPHDPADRNSGHYGLIGMKERASHIGANFELSTVPGYGTTVAVLLPAVKKGHNATAPTSAEEEHDQEV